MAWLFARIPTRLHALMVKLRPLRASDPWGSTLLLSRPLCDRIRKYTTLCEPTPQRERRAYPQDRPLWFQDAAGPPISASPCFKAVGNMQVPVDATIHTLATETIGEVSVGPQWSICPVSRMGTEHVAELHLVWVL